MNADSLGPEDFNAMADYLRDRLHKLSEGLGDGENIIRPMLAVIEDHRLHAMPNQDVLTANGLARRTLLGLTEMYKNEADYPPEWRSELSD